MNSIPVLLVLVLVYRYSEAYTSEAGAVCPFLMVYRDDLIELEDSILLPDQNLILKADVSNGLAPQYSSLGISPRMSLCNDQTVSSMNHTISWNQNENVWVVTMAASGCGLDCCVKMIMENMANGCGLMEWKGHVLQVSEVPLLQWLVQLHGGYPSTPTSSSVFHSHLQCSPQVSVMIAGQELSYTTNWYRDNTNISYDTCSLMGLASVDCAQLELEDLTLTHSALLLLTSQGLYKSNIPSGRLVLQEVPFPVQDARFVEQTLLHCRDPDGHALPEEVRHGVSSKWHFLWRSHTNGSRGAILFNELVQVKVTESDHSVVVYSSSSPYTNWTLQSTLCASSCSQVLTTYDAQRMTFITVISNSSVIHTSSGQLLGNTSLTHTFYHPTSSAVYVLGSQVWLSVDAGMTYIHILTLSNPVISYSHNEQSVLFLTASGELYFSHPGRRYFTKLTSILNIHPHIKIALDGSNAYRKIDLSSKTSEHFDISTNIQMVGPCLLSYIFVEPQLLYVFDNQTNCSVQAYVGSNANSQRFGTGLVTMGPLSRGAFITLTAPVQYHDRGEEMWLFREEQCLAQLSPGTGFTGTTHAYELDMWDSVELQVIAVSHKGRQLPRHLLEITVNLGNPELFDVSVRSSYAPTTHTITATLWQKNVTMYPMCSSVTFHWVYCSSQCEVCSITAILLTKCPSGKQLKFHYPPPEQLYTLPVNYRPPSARGVAIYTSPHVYNADPSKSINSLFSEVEAQLKQCLHMANRTECGCSQDQHNSTYISNSDCITMVYRHLYETVFPLTFVLSSESGQENTSAVQLEELNGRSDFIQINNSRVSAIRFQGPGLFHFEAVLVSTTSFCQLSTQFTVFVEHTPLPKVGELTVTSLTTVVFGLLTFFIYLIHYLKQSKKYRQQTH